MKIKVKNTIINSASTNFSKLGFNKTTMDVIARQIHKAKGVLYYYFESKEMLYNEVLKKELDAVKLQLNKIVNSENHPLEILKSYMLTRLQLLSKAPTYLETLKSDFLEKYHFVENVMNDFDEFEHIQLTCILEKCKSEGILSGIEVKTAMEVIMMMLKGIAIQMFLQNKYSEYENNIDELSSLVVRGLIGNKT